MPPHSSFPANATNKHTDRLRARIRHFHASTAHHTPFSAMAFEHRDGKVYFIGSDPRHTRSRIATLYSVDVRRKDGVITTDAVTDNLSDAITLNPPPPPIREWTPLLTPTFHIELPYPITEYALTFYNSLPLILFVCNGRLFSLTPASSTIPRRIQTPTPVHSVSVTTLPSTHDEIDREKSQVWIGFSAKRDIYCCDLEGNLRRVTHSQPDETCGDVEFVMQEEFRRYRSWWWDTESTTVYRRDRTQDRAPRMLHLRTDLSRVEKVYLPTTTSGGGHDKDHDSDGEGRVHYYPKAGTANATSVLEVVEFAEDMKVRRRLRCALKAWFDWIEYLPRVGWVGGYDGVWVWGLDRAQERGVIVLVPLESFQECKEQEAAGEDVDPSTTEKQVFVLYEEQTSYWITATDCISLWLSSKASVSGTLNPQTHDLEIRFTFTSDCTGFRHLYIGSFDPLAPTQSVPSASVIRNGKAYTTVYPQPTITPLTSGPYTVMDSPIYVDVNRGWVYAHARWDVGETGVFRVDYTQKPPVDSGCDASLVRLTKRGISHHFTFHPLLQYEGGKSEVMVVDQWSHLSEYGIDILTLADASPSSSSSGCGITAASDYKHGVNGAKLVCQIQPAQWTAFTALCRAKEALNELIPLSKPKVFRFRNSAGLLIYGCFYPATNSTTTSTQSPQSPPSPSPRPTILQMYGGPTISTITNTYTYPRHARVALWNSLGLNVVLVDNRGTSERGREFEQGVKYQKQTAHNGEGSGTYGGLGTVEIRDWIETLVFLVHGAGTTTPRSAVENPQTGHNVWPYDDTDDSNPIFDIRSLHITPTTDLLPFLTAASHTDGQTRHTEIDVTRVYTLGWSYGGFLSLLMYLKYPSLIRKSVAGAPVCDWRWYDAGYTERYLGIPNSISNDPMISDDPMDPYTRASIIDILKLGDVQRGLIRRRCETEERGAESLLFVHGKRDDNVLWKGVQGVVGELERVDREGGCEPGKSDSERDANEEGERERFFKLMLYETEGHGLRSRKTVEEFEVCVARIFECS